MKSQVFKSSARTLRKIGLLSWKNFVIRRRHWIITSFEIVLPTLVAILLAWLNTKVDIGAAGGDSGSGYHEGNTTFDELNEESLVSDANWRFARSTIGYTPNTTFTSTIIESLSKEFSSEIDWHGFDTELEIEAYGMENERESVGRLEAAIVFEEGVGGDNPSQDFPKGHTFSYKLRVTQYSYYGGSETGPGNDNYYPSHFSALQIKMDKVLIGMLAKEAPTEEVIIQGSPYPPYSYDWDEKGLFETILPILLPVGYIFIIPSIIRGVGGEKETGIRELMKMMGLPSWMHWLGWMINSMIVLVLNVTIMTILLFITFKAEYGGVLDHSNPFLFWIFLVVFSAASTAFCFFISAFFQRPSLAIAVGIILWLTLSNLGSFVDFDGVNHAGRMAICLIPNFALAFFLKIVLKFESQEVGVRWSNFFDRTSRTDPLAVGHIFFMMILSCFLYIALTLYLENIIPSQYGVRRPWYYIFQPSTWWTSSKPAKIVSSGPAPKDEHMSSVQPDPDGIAVGVEIYKLRKVFGSGKVAVDDVTLKIFDGQITALLGHNGAGKTTMMSMLTGMFAPTSGKAIVSGHDISVDLEGARQTLGLCPQHNMLFDKLTVMEHLIFFGMLKGLTRSKVTAEADSLVKKLGLDEKRNALSMSLSGGQKRRLNLSMALIGGSKVVILDEPTSGMDPEARRALWDLLLEMRGERTLILTTHFMEEADVLGDRVAIMAEGKIKCCGTPMFLKSYYGAGYTLSMTLESESSPEQYITAHILSTVQKYVKNAFFKSQQGPSSSEIAITLPMGDITTSKFPDMFADLEQNKKMLGIRTIGLSLTTMDEVFVKVGEMDHSKVENNDAHEWSKDASSSSLDNLYKDKKDVRLSGLRLSFQQFHGLLMKRCLYFVRKRKLFISQLLLPVLILMVAILLSNGQTTRKRSSTSIPVNKISLSSYTNPIILYTAEDEDLGHYYSEALGSFGKLVEGSMSDALLEAGLTNLESYRNQYIVAAELNGSYVKGWHSTANLQASPLSVNLLTNTLLQRLAPGEDYSIEISTQRLPSSSMSDFDFYEPDGFQVALWFGVLLPIGLALLSASFIVFPVEERLCKAKQLQLMTGVNPLIYWGSAFVWDFFVMLLMICIMVACFPIFQTQGTFTANDGGGVLFLILMVYGFAAISLSYLLSMLVSTVAGGFSLVSILHMLSGIILCTIVYSLDAKRANLLRWFSRPFPTFGCAISIMEFAEVAVSNSRCKLFTQADEDTYCDPSKDLPPFYRSCCAKCSVDFPDSECFKTEPYIRWSRVGEALTGEPETIPAIGQELMFTFIMGVVFQVILILVEFGILKRLLGFLFKADSMAFAPNQTDEDVTREIERVQSLVNSGQSSEDAIVVSDLCKSYSDFAAVSNISFGVHHGECFGLLGVNGAGKTTTFRMLTGDEIRSHGNAYTSMCNLETGRKDFLANIGYCPQFDGIVEVLTGKEMLQLFGRLRGIVPTETEKQAYKWLERLGLSASADVQCGRYSGGMKRRLSAAMALIGDPPVVMLDEPTSGVDPVARRQFWKVIKSVRESGQAVILTSHSMEECEALCSRLGIMVNGQMQCLGGVQHLKNKFAQGFSLIVKLKPMLVLDSPEVAALCNEIGDKFRPCVLKDKHQTLLHFQVLNTALPWGDLFKIMEDLKQRYELFIEDYSVNETTLEEVFLSFARKQYVSRKADVSFLKKLITCQCMK